MRTIRIVAVTILLCIIPGAFAEQRSSTPAAAPPKGLRVYYASHSLMWYVPKILPEVVAAAGIQGQEIVGVQAIGASRTLQHWEKEEPNEAKKALETGKVDVFVMCPIHSLRRNGQSPG